VPGNTRILMFRLHGLHTGATQTERTINKGNKKEKSNTTNHTQRS